MKLSTALISLQCAFLSFHGIDAFMSSLPRTTFQPRTNPLYYIEIEKGQPESIPKTRTDPVWIEETFMERAVDCTEVEEECDIEELGLLVDSKCFYVIDRSYLFLFSFRMQPVSFLSCHFFLRSLK